MCDLTFSSWLVLVFGQRWVVTGAFVNGFLTDSFMNRLVTDSFMNWFVTDAFMNGVTDSFVNWFVNDCFIHPMTHSCQFPGSHGITRARAVAGAARALEEADDAEGQENATVAAVDADVAHSAIQQDENVHNGEGGILHESGNGEGFPGLGD